MSYLEDSEQRRIFSENLRKYIGRSGKTQKDIAIDLDVNPPTFSMWVKGKARTATMRKTAREIRAYNPIPSHFNNYQNNPIKYMVEDILEKDSKESYFIQICDFISYFVNAYFKTHYLGKEISGRASNVISKSTIDWVLNNFNRYGILNTKASSNPFGLVIYPK